MTFEQLEDLFFTLQVKADPSGFHGFLCGRLCCGTMPLETLVETSTSWLGLNEEQGEAVENPLRDFYEEALTSLEDISFIFQPILPDDELPLPERLVAVGAWLVDSDRTAAGRAGLAICVGLANTAVQRAAPLRDSGIGDAGS